MTRPPLPRPIVRYVRRAGLSARDRRTLLTCLRMGAGRQSLDSAFAVARLAVALLRGSVARREVERAFSPTPGAFSPPAPR